MQDLHYYLGFNLVNGIGPARLDRLIAYFGSLEDAWNSHTGDLALAGLDGRSIDALFEIRHTRDLEAEYERVVAAGVRIISRDEPAYPALLRGIPASPPLLYVRGTLTENDRWALAVVGTRNCSNYGRDAARKLVSDLAAAGVTIVCGLALVVLVVESGVRSGALITVEFALEQGRDVFAVPGSIFSPRSEGTHRLIRDGATIVTRAEDVLEALNLQNAVEQQAVAAAVPETPEEAALLRLVEAEPRHIDAITRDSALSLPEVSATLAMLELKGLVKQVGGMQYVLAREDRAPYLLE